MKSITSAIVVTFILGQPVQTNAAKNADLPPVLAKRGKLTFTDDFEKSNFGKMWKSVRGEWKVSDGHVVGRELKSEKHAAVFHLLKKNRNSIFRFSFKMDGAKQFHFSLNHTKGHLFRIVVTPNSLVVRTDADKRDKAIKSESIGKASGKFVAGEWYTMQVEMVGDQVAVTTDNGLRVSGRHKRLDTAKPHYRFILRDEFLALDDIKVWEATAK